MQGYKVQDRYWNNLPDANVTGGSALEAFHPASWILYPESGS
jgi:hypothetical protein